MSETQNLMYNFYFHAANNEIPLNLTSRDVFIKEEPAFCDKSREYSSVYIYAIIIVFVVSLLCESEGELFRLGTTRKAEVLYR
jgi:hypothetical protein